MCRESYAQTNKKGNSRFRRIQHKWNGRSAGARACLLRMQMKLYDTLMWWPVRGAWEIIAIIISLFFSSNSMCTVHKNLHHEHSIHFHPDQQNLFEKIANFSMVIQVNCVLPVAYTIYVSFALFNDLFSLLPPSMLVVVLMLFMPLHVSNCDSHANEINYHK